MYMEINNNTCDISNSVFFLRINQDARITNVFDGTKRAGTNERDLLIMAKPTGREIKWKIGVLQVYCCVNTFDPKEPCKLVICEGCHIINDLAADVEKVSKRGKKLKRNIS